MYKKTTDSSESVVFCSVTYRKSADVYVYSLAAICGCSLDNCTNSLSNSTVFTDNHTHIFGSYAKREVNAVLGLIANYNDLIRAVNYSCRYVTKCCL